MAGNGIESRHRHALSRAVVSKLPLLDGETYLTARLTTVKVNVERIEKLQEVYEEDRTRVKGMICTAWGLLLRCYTGQDDVCFYFRRSNGAPPSQPPPATQDPRSILRMSFFETESLLDHILRAQDGVTVLEQRPNSTNSTTLDASPPSASYDSNTMIWFQDDGQPAAGPYKGLRGLQDHEIVKVCGMALGQLRRAMAGDTKDHRLAMKSMLFDLTEQSLRQQSDAWSHCYVKRQPFVSPAGAESVLEN